MAAEAPSGVIGIDQGLLAFALDTAPFGIALADRSGKALSATTGFHRLMGTDGRAFPGSSLKETFRIGGISWERMTAHPGTELIETYEKPGSTRRTLMITSAETEADSSGNSFIAVFVADFSRRSRVERALRDSETRARGFFEQDLVGMARMSTDGAFLEVNNTFCRFVGLSRDELINSDLYALCRDDPEELRRFLAGLVEGELATGVRELDLKHPDGVVRPFRVYFGPEKGDDGTEVAAIVALYEDIGNERAAAREAEERRQQLIRADRMTTLGTLVSGTAHEISNPNQVIMANAELAQSAWRAAAPFLAKDAVESPDTEVSAVGGMERYLSRIGEGARRIDRIVEDMKSFAQDGGTPLPSRISLNEAALRAASLLEGAIEKATSRFSLELDADLPRVSANLSRIEQIVVNLIMNACQALRSQNETLCVRTRSEGGDALLEVLDGGIGIPEESLGKVTDPFFTSRRKEGGTGLGLAVAEGIAGDYGGRLEFARRDGGGTAARLRLPALDH